MSIFLENYVCTVNTGLLQLRVEKDSTANIQPNVKWPTMRVIGALISTIFLLYNARGYVYSLISRLENEREPFWMMYVCTFKELH